MAASYSKEHITGGVAYSDTIVINIPAFTISTDANAVTAVLLERKPSADTASPPDVIISSTNLTFVSGSRTAGQDSTWNLTFTSTQTGGLLNENNTIRYGSPVIQVLMRGTADTEREVFTSAPLSVGVSMEAVTAT